MSNTAKNAAVTATAVEEKVVPAQNTGEKKASAISVDTMLDSLDLSSELMENGFKVRVLVDEQGNRSLEVVEEGSKLKTLAGKAKGVFNRNKKLVLATAGLAAASLVLKALARRNEELEADEVVESSDEISTEA
ncbi:hypothetical protein SEA_BILO_33 [Streptomyces phage Bilo]|nr:hypothetical protein SEA_BILO_33 [Streptomyces phage Bilo]